MLECLFVGAQEVYLGGSYVHLTHGNQIRIGVEQRTGLDLPGQVAFLYRASVQSLLHSDPLLLQQVQLLGLLRLGNQKVWHRVKGVDSDWLLFFVQNHLVNLTTELLCVVTETVIQLS